MKNVYLKIGIVIIAAMLLIMIVSVFYTPYDHIAYNVEEKLSSPSGAHLFGTDHMGRDILSRVMTGTQRTFFIAIGTVIIGIVVGTVIGAFSGYFGGLVDETIMRINDALLSFPGLLLALVLVTIWGAKTHMIVIALGIIFIPSYLRVVRGEYVRVRNLDFVNSAKAMGAKPMRIMFLHIFPNVLPQIIPSITIGFSNALLAEASLSFLGLGVKFPATSWGSIISEAQSYIFTAPWFILFPVLMITLSVLGFNFIAEGLKKELAVKK